MKHEYKGKSAEQRIADRLKPSAGETRGDVKTVQGSGAQRVIHTVHSGQGQKQIIKGSDSDGA